MIFLQIILLGFIMDPRPYTYEYRKPRPSNRTFQSYAAYQSLYHMGKVDPQPYAQNFLRQQYSSKMNLYSPNYSNPYSNSIPQQQRYEPPASNQYQSVTAPKRYENIAVNTEKFSNRASSNMSQRSRSSSVSLNSNKQPPVRPSVLSTYGSNSLQKKQNQKTQAKGNDNVNVVYTNYNECAKVYDKQQRPFDIITLYSKPHQPLKKYPKITLEHLILEKGIDIPS